MTAPARTPFEVPGEALVVGFATTGRAVARRLVALGCRVTVVEDRVVPGAQADAGALGVVLLEGRPAADVEALAAASQLVVASPGVPPSHPALRGAPAASLMSEIELAYRLAEVPIVAVTGTNGKTTVTALAAGMLAASGIRAVAAGNIGTPLVEVVPGAGWAPSGDEPAPALVVAEVSSFQLALTTAFRPVVGTWLNLAPDHLDWHGTYESYGAAKARIWARQEADDVAVANIAEPAVLAAARRSPGRLVTFGPGGDYHETGGQLVAPGGAAIVALAELRRTLPHDVANVLAAAATAMSAGATAAGCGEAAAGFEIPAHRVQLVASLGGVKYYDDSKATTPSAVSAALAGFDSVVLIAGGRNKGLDLKAIPHFVESVGHPVLRAVVAIGEATKEVEEAFSGFAPVVAARSMEEAVDAASQAAVAGDAVLLSPGCASFDWYDNYAARGDDFARLVVDRLGAEVVRA